MAEWMIVEFVAINRKLDIKLVRDFVNAVIGKQDKFNVANNNVPVKLEDLVSMMYNNGTGKSASVLIENPKYWLSLGLYAEKDGAQGRLLIDRTDFHEEGNEQSPAVRDFLQRCIRAYNFLRPSYGRGDWEGIFDQQSVEGWKAFPESVTNIKKNLRYVFWLNFYGPEIVAKVEKNKFRTIPYGKLEQLADGAVLLIRGDHPNEYSETHYMEAIRRHLFEK